MPAIGKPPRTHVHSSAVAAGAPEASPFDPKTNRIFVRSSAAWSYAYRGAAPPTALPATGDDAGVAVTAGAWKALTVSVGTDRLAGLELLIQNSATPQTYEIEAEE